MGMVGSKYVWRGQLWLVICRWSGKPAPRNVLIENTVTGQRVVRPFRGLRRPKPV